MDQPRQKHVNITLSIPADLNALLHAKFPHRGISNYVANIVRVALDEEQQKERLALEAAYEEAEKDPERKKLIQEWRAVDAEDDTEGWEW